MLTVALVLLAWLVLAIVVGLVVGAMIALGGD